MASRFGARQKTSFAGQLRPRPVHGVLFRLLLAHARTRIRDRENLRFERTRVFGRVRVIVNAMGRALARDGWLSDPRDVFFLELGELREAIADAALRPALAARVAERRTAYARFAHEPPPPSRFIAIGANPPAPDVAAADSGGDERRGLGCCPGVVRARVRVVADPCAPLQPGEILVAEHTDPGWVVLFPAAAGILVERGSVLSHAAIVSREMGIPSVVAIPGLTRWLHDGDVVEFDGRSGVVRRLEHGIGTSTDARRGPRRYDAPMTIRYAQSWEDADVLHEALAIGPGHVCLTIAAAGDNALALLARSPERVIAIDVNPAQIACLALRVAAYRTLSYDELLAFLGARPSGDRLASYRRCRPLLDDAVRAFWDAAPATIEAGIIRAGRFERYLELFRRAVLPFVHGRGDVDALLARKTRAERARFYDDVWNTVRWRLLFGAFFSRPVMSALGRDGRYFAHVERSVPEHLRSRARHALVELDPSVNPYLRWILTGTYGDVLPYHLRRENVDAIRANLDRLTWECTSLEGYLRVPGPRIDRFALSDVFEYVDEASCAQTLRLIAGRASPNARIAYWNMLVPRSRPPELAGELVPLQRRAAALHATDKAFFYSRFVLELAR